VLDVMAMTKTLELIRHCIKPSAVVLTFCPIQGRELGDTEDAVRQLGATLVPVRVHNRVAFSRAQQTGQTAQEIEPAGKAAEEIKRVYAYTCMHLFPQIAKRCHEPTAKLTASRS
jgi:chromosome partitioning protein